MAIMLQQLQLQAGLNVLEIGTASGYNAALIKQIVGAQGYVTSLEIDRELAQAAQHSLKKAGFADVLVAHRDAVSGYEPRAAYDRIIATAGIWDVPPLWLQQLRRGGRLVAPVWLDGLQLSAAFVPQDDGTYLSRDNRPCAFVFLRGMAAGPRIRKRVGSTSLNILADDVERIDTAALHLLLSDDFEMQNLGRAMRPHDFWHGFQLYLMLHAPPETVFAAYSIPPGQQAYGMTGSGILLFSAGSAAFAAYDGGGLAHSFGAADAFLEMQAGFERWLTLEPALMKRLRLRLIPTALGAPAPQSGKLFRRKDHCLHLWLA